MLSAADGDDIIMPLAIIFPWATYIKLLGIRMHIFASRQFADYARMSYVGAGEALVARVTFSVGEASCLVFVVSKPRWPHCAVIPNLHLHRQRVLSSEHLSESSISECVRLCDAHNYGLYLWYVMTFPVTFLSVTHHICTYILRENRSSIQSLALMCSAINFYTCTN